MLILGIGIFLIIISILLIGYSLRLSNHVHVLNKDIDEENKFLEGQNKIYREEYNQILKQAEDAYNQLDTIKNAVEVTTNKQKELSQQAFENYCLILTQDYESKEQSYNNAVQTLKNSYANLQEEIINKIALVQEDLDKIQATRAAVIQAQLKEKEVKEKRAFYCLTIKETDLDDIKALEKIRPQLHNPRVLSMLIWSTFFQKPMTALCNNIIGTTTKCGIYKITNQKNDMCYIGQSVNIADRWKQHAKCGLGIDTPQKNKLYQAMLEDGLWNFSFEVIEECPAAQLDEKERYYISLFQSYEYGYNSNKGNK